MAKICNSKIITFEIKIILSILLFIFYGFKIDLLFDNSYKPNNITLIENFYNDQFINLKDKSLSKNELLNAEKKKLLKYLSEKNKKEIIPKKNIFCKCKYKFGNILIALNKILFYYDIIGYNHIILDNNDFWFIKNKIYIEKYNLTLEVEDSSKYNDSFNNDVLFMNTCPFYHFVYKLKTDIRIHYLRDEILKNLPKVIVSADNLYIHVRSGDIFSYRPNRDYAQLPLCFYIKILNNFNFKKIVIISEGKNNPIINILMEKYNNIIFNKNSIVVDISYLVNAYNIVGSISSFLTIILLFNYNLRYIWDYNIYKIEQKMLHYHYDFYKFPHNNFTIFRMEPSDFYKEKMYFFVNSKKQKYILLNEKCNNNFTIINRKN